jgi:tRNA 2-thiocytidine biosynthesis protein TtcA
LNNVNISKKIMKAVGKTNCEFNLVEEGDKVLLGLSGGKDSLSLAHIMKEQQRRIPFKYEFEAVTISYGMGEDYSTLSKHCEEYGIKHHVHETQIYELSHDKMRENSSACSFFSRMRRGALYTYAIENGFNKLALGHHMDDAAESYFMNLFYNGSMRSLAPVYKAQRGLTVIRPLIQVRERQLIAWAHENAMDVIGDEMCPGLRIDAKMPHARAKMKSMLYKMEEDFPDLFTSMKAAFRNIHDDTFFDVDKHKR